jgi:ADP-ribose pyrophosphatase YjhB (NUDIX family)
MTHTKSGNRIIINFPGGGLDGKERPEDAVVREFEEESGDAVEIVRHLFSSDGTYVNPDYPNNRMQCHYYLVRAALPLKLRGTADDITSLEWFPLTALPFERMLEVDADFSRALPRLLAACRP